MTLNYKQTCRLFSYCRFTNSGTTNVPDFFEDAFDSEMYSDTEYSAIVTFVEGAITALNNNNLYGTTKQGSTYQITTSDISPSTAPPHR